MKTLPIGTDFQARQEARVRLGRLLQGALTRGQRAVQAADDAARAPYRPSNPALLRELKRCLLAAAQEGRPCTKCGTNRYGPLNSGNLCCACGEEDE